MNSQSFNPGLLLVISAPSGAGKTTLARRLVQDIPDAVSSISYTTRPPRGQEQNGRDYHFVDVLAFKEKIERGELVEWAEVHGHFYGTPKEAIDKIKATNGLAVFDIDVQGGHSIKQKYPSAVLVFVLPPSMQELERRLRLRGTDSDETIHGRMLGARSEIERGTSTYDYILINADLEAAYKQLFAVVVAERCRRERVDVSAIKL